VLLTCSSPGKTTNAIFYWVYGGGAAGWAFFRVAIEPAGRALDPDEYVFGMRHGYDVRLTWNGESELVLEYPDKAVIDKHREVLERMTLGRAPFPSTIQIKYAAAPTIKEGSLEGGSTCSALQGPYSTDL
jgi:hypothetical protein